MKERTKRKLLGKWTYSVYRRTRYIRYLKKIRKERKKQNKLEARLEKKAYRDNIKAKEREDKILNKRKQKLERSEFDVAKVEAKSTIKSRSKDKIKEDKRKARDLKQQQKEEQAEVKKRIRDKALQDRALLLKQKVTRKRAKKDRKRRIREIRPYILKRRTRELYRGIRSINWSTFSRWSRWFVGLVENRSDRNKFLKITLNSFFLFILSYMVLYALGEFITVFAAQSFEYDTVLYYFKIYYNIESEQWTGDAVKVLYTIKPALGLILAVISISVYSTLKNNNNVFKVFFLWMFVHGMVMFFGSLLMGTLLNQGFGWVIAYLYYKDTGKMVFSILAIFALLVTGTSIARSFLISGNTYFNSISSENRKFLLVSQILLPAILGTAALSMLKIPEEYYYVTSEEVIYEILKLSTILLVIIPTILTFSAFTETYFDEDPRRVRIKWLYMIISIAAFMTYRILLADGIEFIV